MTGLGIAGIRRNAVVLVKTAEVVNAHHIVKLEAVPHSGDPPVVTGFLVVVPVVKGIAPNLTVFAERIGRTSGDLGRFIILVQLEQFRLRPNIGAIRGNINRNIAHDLNVLFVGVFLQLHPLGIKLEL